MCVLFVVVVFGFVLFVVSTWAPYSQPMRTCSGGKHESGEMEPHFRLQTCCPGSGAWKLEHGNERGSDLDRGRKSKRIKKGKGLRT